MDRLNEASVTEEFQQIGSFDHLVVTAVADGNKLRLPIGAMTSKIALCARGIASCEPQAFCRLPHSGPLA
jgi:hypothetical protein